MTHADYIFTNSPCFKCKHFGFIKRNGVLNLECLIEKTEVEAPEKTIATMTLAPQCDKFEKDFNFDLAQIKEEKCEY